MHILEAGEGVLWQGEYETTQDIDLRFRKR